ncbi:uncharacterized protein LOC114857762 isoform X3 [Betta splendens]|uniref:Uncharacterized protein LOC114857762 isoform X3 n=1 Tax=Betta splendens TaxID=158456 RepID=A0A6P7MVY7_BETSP|nr:uncharacterized protein LOC114857762 isoform X3 [Betta splendens]
MSVVLLLLFSVCIPPLSAAPPPPVAPTKPTTTLRVVGSTASGAQASVQVTLNAAQRPAGSAASVSASSSTGNMGTSDPKKQPTEQCPVTERRNLVGVSGQTLTLPCRAPANASVMAVMWTRRDLKTENVLLVQDGKAVLVDQQPWFRGRVTLKNQLAKSGDLSLVLKDVKPGDTGTYECRYKERRAMMIITSDSVSTVTLTVPLAGDGSDDAKRQHTMRTMTLSVVGVIVLFVLFVVVVVTICRRCRR